MPTDLILWYFYLKLFSSSSTSSPTYFATRTTPQIPVTNSFTEHFDTRLKVFSTMWVTKHIIYLICFAWPVVVLLLHFASCICWLRLQKLTPYYVYWNGTQFRNHLLIPHIIGYYVPCCSSVERTRKTYYIYILVFYIMTNCFPFRTHLFSINQHRMWDVIKIFYY